MGTSVCSPMTTIASRDQFKPIRFGENLNFKCSKLSGLRLGLHQSHVIPYFHYTFCLR